MANISQIKLPNNTTYDIKDNNALPLTGGSITGPVSFGDSVDIEDLATNSLVVEGSASIVDNLAVSSINGVTVGSNQVTATAFVFSGGGAMTKQWYDNVNEKIRNL